jgi:hypothetical protein
MSQSIVSETNNDVAALVDAWCDRRAIGPLRVILGCYPILNNLTDDWATLANGLRTIRVQHARELDPSEMDVVVRLQQLAESVVYR